MRASYNSGTYRKNFTNIIADMKMRASYNIESKRMHFDGIIADMKMRASYNGGRDHT